jgi:AcrR family transcriptional regulator
MKTVSPQNLKNQILTESVKILGQAGLDGLSLREVAKKLNVTHQAPYHYFADKGALLLELKKMGFHMLNEAMQTTLAGKKTPAETVENLGLTYFDFCTQNPGFYRAMFSATSTGESVRVPEAEQAFACLKKSIVGIQASGLLKGRDPEIISMICWTYMHGYVALTLEKYPVIGGKYDARELARKMIKEMSALIIG